MNTAAETNKGSKAFSLKKISDARRSHAVTCSTAFSRGVKKASGLLKQWIEDNVINRQKVEFLPSTARKDHTIEGKAHQLV